MIEPHQSEKLLLETTMKDITSMRPMRHIALLFISLLAILATQQSMAATLSSIPNRTELAIDETLNLIIRYEGGQVSEKPNLQLLQQNFDILRQNQSNQLSFVNGKRSSLTEWTYVLAPKKEGQLLIPSFEINGVFSDAVMINVSAATTNIKGQVRDIFVTTELDKEEAYTNEQVILKLKLFTRYELNNLQATDLTINGTTLKPLGQKQFNKNIQGMNYLVLEVSYAVFPSQAGVLNIPPITFSANIASRRQSLFDPFGSNGQIVRPRSQAKTIIVKPIPAQFSGKAWLPANGVSLSQKWSQDINQITVGQPITRTIVIQADGQESSRLPPLPTHTIQGLKNYPDQAQLEDNTNTGQVTGTRKESAAWVATEPGTFVIPKTTVEWWDNREQKIRTATLPEQRLQVIAGADTQATPQQTSGSPEAPGVDNEPPAFAVEQETVSNFNHWYFYLLLFATNIGFIVLWLKERSRAQRLELYGASYNSKSTSNKLSQVSRQAQSKLAHEVTQAAKANDTKRFRLALIAWAKYKWRNQVINGLHDIPCHTAPNLHAALLQLDNSLYGADAGNTDQPNLNLLWQELKKHADQPLSQNKNQSLKSLYGN